MVTVQLLVVSDRVASRNFLTICLMEILTISTQRGLTRHAAEGGSMGPGHAITRVRSQHL